MNKNEKIALALVITLYFVLIFVVWGSFGFFMGVTFGWIGVLVGPLVTMTVTYFVQRSDWFRSAFDGLFGWIYDRLEGAKVK